MSPDLRNIMDTLLEQDLERMAAIRGTDADVPDNDVARDLERRRVNVHIDFKDRRTADYRRYESDVLDPRD